MTKYVMKLLFNRVVLVQRNLKLLCFFN